MSKNSLTKIDEPQEVVIHKQTTIQGYSSEEELQQLVGKGEWELLLGLATFQKRSPESQIQLFREAIDARIPQLRKSFNYLINKGPKERSAAIGILQRIQDLENLRDESLENFYRDGIRSIAEKAGIKIEFY